MYPLIEALALQKEREIATRTRSPLFAESAAKSFLGVRRAGAKGGMLRSRNVPLARLSPGAWRRWAVRTDVHCSRSASLAGC